MSPAAGAVELLSIARFQEELRRVARVTSAALVGHPLDAVVKKIAQNPAFSQCRLLTRVLTALTYQQGEFRRAEIAAFDTDTLAIVINLMNAHDAGTSTPDEWIAAVEAARVAGVAAGG